MVKKVGKYELGKTLGEGTFGKVKYAMDTETNEAVAIKILDKEKIQKQNMGNQIKKEISIMKMVKHTNIVGMIEVLASKTKIFIVLELITGGELFDKIVQVGKLTEDQARFYFQQLIDGVEYCHKHGVCHRDLKPENLLLDEHGNLKISDFGLSSLYIGDAEGSDATSRTELLHTTCGTPNYVAPEVLSDQGYDGKKADVWSCGVILYVLLAGFLPFDESTIVALFAKIQSADFTYPSWFTPEVRSLLDLMLVADPKTRAQIPGIKNHSWYLGTGDIPQLNIDDEEEEQDSAPMVPTPTAAQMDAAVNNTTGEYHEEEDLPLNTSYPVKLNAFDFVTQCGGFMLDRMFSPEIFYTVQGVDDAEKESFMSKKQSFTNVGGAVLFGSKNVKSKCYHFTASNIDPIELTKFIYEALESIGFDFNDKDKPKASVIKSGLIVTSLLTPKGMVGMRIQVFAITPSLSFVEIRKGKGDLLEWSNAFSELVDKKISHLVNRANAGEDSKA